LAHHQTNAVRTRGMATHPRHEASPTSTFDVIVHGVVESAECLESDMLYARTVLVKGADWSFKPVTSGDSPQRSEVITQMSERLPGPSAVFVWNAPFECALRSTNVSGWPQIAVALTTINSNGTDTVVGYARCHVPLHAGRHTLDLPLMQPVFSTPQHALFGALSGVKPELRDLSFLCSTDDRIVMQSRRIPGYVRLTLSVFVVGLEHLGYDV